MKCHHCGNPLPLDDRGIPTACLWQDGKWFCPDCKFKKDKNEKIQTDSAS